MEVPRITAQEASGKIDRGEKVHFVDCRNDQDWSKSGEKLPGAMRVPADQAATHVNGFPGDSTIITYCT